jgi:hypothetical protein
MNSILFNEGLLVVLMRLLKQTTPVLLMAVSCLFYIGCGETEDPAPASSNSSSVAPAEGDMSDGSGTKAEVSDGSGTKTEMSEEKNDGSGSK